MSYFQTCSLFLFWKRESFQLGPKSVVSNLLFEERMLVPVLYYWCWEHPMLTYQAYIGKSIFLMLSMKVLQWNQTSHAKFNCSVPLLTEMCWFVIRQHYRHWPFVGCEDLVRLVIPRVSDRQTTESSRWFWNWRFHLYVHVCHLGRDTYCDWNLCIFAYTTSISKL